MGLAAELEFFHDAGVVEEFRFGDGDGAHGGAEDQAVAVLGRGVEDFGGGGHVAELRGGDGGIEGFEGGEVGAQEGAAGREGGGEETVTHARAVAIAGAVFEFPAAAEVEVRFQRELGELEVGADGVVEIEFAVGAREAEAGEFGAGEGAVLAVEAVDGFHVAGGIEGKGRAEVETDAVLDAFEAEIDGASGEFATDGDADLAARVEFEAGITDAVGAAVITADACIPIAHRAAGVEIKAPVTEVAAFEAQDAFGARIALARDVVDGAAGCVGGENGRRAAAHDLEGLDRLVHAEGLVGVEPAERGVVLDR